jgi:hypothetical protein
LHLTGVEPQNLRTLVIDPYNAMGGRH